MIDDVPLEQHAEHGYRLNCKLNDLHHLIQAFNNLRYGSTDDDRAQYHEAWQRIEMYCQAIDSVDFTDTPALTPGLPVVVLPDQLENTP